MMVQARCIDRYYSGSGRITGYLLQDLEGGTLEINADELKHAIRCKQINVVNLRLTNDNRLMNIKENTENT